MYIATRMSMKPNVGKHSAPRLYSDKTKGYNKFPCILMGSQAFCRVLYTKYVCSANNQPGR